MRLCTNYLTSNVTQNGLCGGVVVELAPKKKKKKNKKKKKINLLFMKPVVGFLDGLIGRNSPGKAGCITRPASSGMSGFIWFHVSGKVDCRFFLACCFLDGLGWKISQLAQTFLFKRLCRLLCMEPS